jgi:tetratricopeptide (TPR) repeat protein
MKRLATARRYALAAAGFATLVSAAAHADDMAICQQLRDTQAALAACTAVIDQPGTAAEQKALAYRYRARLRAAAGADELAVTDFSTAVSLDPGDAQAFAGRGQTLLKLGDLDAAIADFGTALGLGPARSLMPDILLNRGHAHLVNDNPDAAIADFSAALQYNPQSASAYNNRGLAHRKKGDLDQAIADYSAALSLNSGYALAYNNRGYAREAKGDRDAAISDFRKALALDRSLTGAADGLKRLNAAGALAAETGAMINQGKTLVEANCSRCHAVGLTGSSPNPKAPAFRLLQQRHPVLALREPLSRGIVAPHDEMPDFKLMPEQIDAIIAYINSLPAPASR